MINIEIKDNIRIDLPKGLDVWITNVIKYYKFKLGDIGYFIADDEYVLNINKEHLQHDYYTDIITFNYCEQKLLSGDIYVSYDRVKDYALKNDLEIQSELLRVLIHGILHLVGFKDSTDLEKKEMRAAEDLALSMWEEKNEI